MALTKTTREKDTVSVTSPSLTTLIELKTDSYDKLNCQFKTITQSLDQFVISAKTGPDADYQILYSSAGSYTTPSGLLETCSGDLTTQAAGTSGGFTMAVSGFYQVKIQASAATGTASVTIYTGLR